MFLCAAAFPLAECQRPGVLVVEVVLKNEGKVVGDDLGDVCQILVPREVRHVDGVVTWGAGGRIGLVRSLPFLALQPADCVQENRYCDCVYVRDELYPAGLLRPQNCSAWVWVGVWGLGLGLGWGWGWGWYDSGWSLL